MATKMSNFKPKKDALVETKSKRDVNLENLRIVQKNLVFVSGLPSTLADADLLKSNEYFGRYGKVSKVVTNPQQPLRKPCSYQAYVTYTNSTDAAIAITALDGFNFEQKPLKVSFGTTKYCAHFLRGYQCLNPDCFYLHDYDRKNQVLNKDTKTIFEQQNQEALDIVCQNLDEIAERIAQISSQMPEDGFPSLMEMMEFLVQSKIITNNQLQNVIKKQNSLKLPKLVSNLSSPASSKTKPDSPKQIKLTKSNSFSTVGSPSKSQTQFQRKATFYEKQSQQKQKVDRKDILIVQNKQLQQKQQKQQKTQKQQKKQKLQKTQKQQKQQKIQKLQKVQIKQNKQQNNSTKTPNQQQMDSIIQKQFLKHIFKLNEKSKSKMQFAGQTQWMQMHKIKEIVQKHLIISN